MLRTVYLELQEIKANSEAILFSISQLEDWLNSQENGQLGLGLGLSGGEDQLPGGHEIQRVTAKDM
jgi:hypothetical protein